jgi:hypothetical protein
MTTHGTSADADHRPVGAWDSSGMSESCCVAVLVGALDW